MLHHQLQKFVGLCQTSAHELHIELHAYAEKRLPKQKCQLALPCGISNVYQLTAKPTRAKWGESQSRGGCFFPAIQCWPGKKLELFDWEVPWSSNRVTGLAGGSQGDLWCQDKLYVNHRETAGSLCELDQVLQEKASCPCWVLQW